MSIHFKKSNKLSSLLKVYFNFSYYLLVSPFRIVYDKQHRINITKQSHLQSVLCAASNLLALFHIIGGIRIGLNELTSNNESSQNPVLYFEFLTKIFTAVLKVTIFKRFWFNRSAFINIVNFINEHETYEFPMQNWMVRYSGSQN